MQQTGIEVHFDKTNELDLFLLKAITLKYLRKFFFAQKDPVYATPMERMQYVQIHIKKWLNLLCVVL